MSGRHYPCPEKPNTPSKHLECRATLERKSPPYRVVAHLTGS